MTTIPGSLAIVVPVFNDADNLRACLSSLVYARGNRDVPIWVVDDGSTDASCTVADEFGALCFRQPQNRGQSAARNAGAAQSQAEYLLFLDSDVVVPADCFDELDRFIRMEKPAGLVGMQGVFSLKHPFPSWSSLIYNALQHLLTRGPQLSRDINTSLFLIPRQEFERVGGFAEALWFMEDNDLAQRLVAQGKHVLHGPIHFIHRKRVTWSWLIRTHLLGGKMQHVLWEQRHGAPAKGQQVGRRNHCFLRWLVAGALLICGTAAYVLLHVCGRSGPQAGLACVVVPFAAYLVADLRVLFSVRRNPLFVLVGVATLMVVPWLILCGRLLGTISPPSATERRRWHGDKLEGKAVAGGVT